MKNKLPIIALIGFALTACATPNGSSSSIAPAFTRDSVTIVTPTGAPALAFYNYAELTNFETNSNPTNITAMMSAAQKDVIVLPTNVGVKTIETAQAPYKLAATITFGNFYIASLGNDDNGIMDATDNIVLFQKNNVPDKLFHYIYGTTLDAGVHYVNAVNEATQALNSGTFIDEETGTTKTAHYVMIAEPAFSTIKANKENVTMYANIQDEYKEKSGDLELFQASIFVKNTLPEAKINGFLTSLKEDVDAAIDEPTLLSAGMNKVANAQTIFGVAPTMAENVLRNNNGMGLGFKLAKPNKEAIDNFLALFNIEETDEEIYF